MANLDDVKITVKDDGTAVVEFEEMTPALLRLLVDLGVVPESGVQPCIRFGLGGFDDPDS
jgi:hypothetical protein